MERKPTGTPERGLEENLHPLVYRIMIGCAAFFALAGAGFLVGPEYSSVVFGVVCVFALVTLLIPLTIHRIWTYHPAVHGMAPLRPTLRSFNKWGQRDLAIWQGRIPASEAVVNILLPLVAPCVEALLFLTVFYVVSAQTGH